MVGDESYRDLRLYHFRPLEIQEQVQSVRFVMTDLGESEVSKDLFEKVDPTVLKFTSEHEFEAVELSDKQRESFLIVLCLRDFMHTPPVYWYGGYIFASETPSSLDLLEFFAML